MSLYRHTRGYGPDLVLVHGWGMNSAVWEPIVPGLSERFRLTIIELPGHGGSAPAATGPFCWTRMDFWRRDRVATSFWSGKECC